jgi:hypothetical protein
MQCCNPPDEGLYECLICGQRWNGPKAVAKFAYEQEWLRQKEATIGPIDYPSITPILEGIEERYQTAPVSPTPFAIEHSLYMPWRILASSHVWEHGSLSEWAQAMGYTNMGQWDYQRADLFGPWIEQFAMNRPEDKCVYVKLYRYAETVGVCWNNPITNSDLMVQVPWHDFLKAYNEYAVRYYAHPPGPILVPTRDFVSARNEGRGYQYPDPPIY